MSVLLELIDISQKADLTKEEYKRCVGAFLAYAGTDPSGWSPRVVAAWRDHLRGSGLKPRTVNKYLYALRFAAKQYEAFENGLDFARAVEALHIVDEAKRDALTVDEVRRMIATCALNRPRDIRDRAIITVGVRTGLRASELAGLAWRMLDGYIATLTTKGRKVRPVALDDACIAALKQWSEWMEAQGYQVRGQIFRGVSQQDINSGYRITQRLTRHKVRKAVSDRGKQAGIERPVFPHLFRHTFISWALDANVPLQRIMVQTGHASLATLSKYVTDLEAATDPIGNYLPGLESDDD